MGQVTGDRGKDRLTEELKIVWRIEVISEDCLGRLSAADTKPGVSCSTGRSRAAAERPADNSPSSAVARDVLHCVPRLHSPHSPREPATTDLRDNHTLNG